MRQYHRLKAAHPGAILFFRLGDFYEMFFDDAEVASPILDITLTARHRGTPSEAPMCGIPHHSAGGYIARLLQAGHKVAIAEQVEDAASAKGMVRREVVRVVTPGTLIEGMCGDDAPAKTMTSAMDAYARSRGIEMVDCLDFSATQRLLDLGCGPGTYAFAIVERYPHVHATLLDLPEPIAEARRLAAARNLSGRLEFVAADAGYYSPDEPFDTILISNTLHLIGPVESPELLKRCYQMLTPGGRVIVQAQYLNDDRTSPRWPTLLNLLQRVASRHGRNHAITETKEWLERARFRNVQHVRFSVWNVNTCLVAERPLNA